jgi:hypothetical protein
LNWEFEKSCVQQRSERVLKKWVELGYCGDGLRSE